MNLFDNPKFLKLYTEEEVSVVMQALSKYMYDNPCVTEEQWENANRVLERIDELL